MNLNPCEILCFSTLLPRYSSAKTEKDPIENERARKLTTPNINFSNIEGQLTLQSFMGPDQILRSSEIL